MSAQFVDALKGYEYFLETRGRASRTEINQYLGSTDRRPIARRTYTHYESLLENGFRSYVPINKFDVFQSLGRLQLAADRRRFQREDDELPIKISRDQTRWADAIAIDRSIVGFGIFTVKRFPVRPGTQLWVRLEGYSSIPVVAVWRNHLADQTRMGIRAFEFIAKYRIKEIPPAPRRTRSLRILRRDEGDLYWANLFRVLEKTDELLKAAEDLVISIDEIVKAGVHPAAPQLSSINFSSPGEAQFKVDLGVAEIIKVLVDKLQFWRDQKRRYRAETDQVELENVNLRIEIARNAINLRREAEEEGIGGQVIADLLNGPMQRALGVDELPPELFEEGSLEEGIVDQRLLPAGTDLVAGDDLDFDIQVDDEDDE